MMLHNFDLKLTPLRPRQAKMGVLLASSNLPSQNHIPPPPTCVMSFMNGPLGSHKLCDLTRGGRGLALVLRLDN